MNLPISKKSLTHLLGFLIAAIAIYFSIKHIRADEWKHAIASMDTFWILPVILCNFIVIAAKAFRWQVTFMPIKKIKFLLSYKVLTISFMANNVLPARLGDVLRIHILGKDALISRVTTTTTLIADRVMEVTSFLLISAVLVLTTDVPAWMKSSLIIILLITVCCYALAIAYSSKKFKRDFLSKLQAGVRSLSSPKIFGIGIISSFVSWGLQCAMVFMTQVAFGIDLPIWGTVLVLVSLNLASAIPSTPSNIGTLEFGCMVAYSFLGVDKSLGLLMGFTYHMLQVIPVTVVGALIVLVDRFQRQKPPLTPAAHDIPC